MCNPNANGGLPFLDFSTPRSYDLSMMLRALLVIAVLNAGVGLVQAQSLAEIAREEAARRKTVSSAAKVYTNDDLRPDFTRPIAPPASTAPDTAATAADAPADQPASGAAGGAPAAPARDQAYWSGRVSEARAQVDRSRAFGQALQNRIDMLWTDFVNRGDPVQQRAIEQERNKALAELERVKRETEDNIKAVAAIEDEARRAGVPAGWLRP